MNIIMNLEDILAQTLLCWAQITKNIWVNLITLSP